ncbi:dynein gamma chain, flagellar outer arm-like isoform X3 [Gigantopelta aegis]|uniref:dynein gamma chain, flagellar outer arm-like isoform X3 n=1 Tax=Gigantopelta aegis TaxID=1735272 RepID=UPI001B88C57A|nr:dynein gamma chain, flagellar outer arm-like isoform X3 [Gigantopelta aegis]
MDERHWWIAGKIQETFKIGGSDNPSVLEEFMCEESTLNRVNKFLSADGPCRLFLYCEKSESGCLSINDLRVTGNLASLKDTDLETVTILYFLRNITEKDVDVTKMNKEIFCGELKHNAIETLNTLLSDIYIPLFKAQKNWDQSTKETQTGLVQSMEKFVIALNETAASMNTSTQWMLKQPEYVLNDFKQQRAAALDPQFIQQYEELVSDWVNTIDTILADTTDERFLDPNAGPLSELDRWRRRQRLLTSLTEQLKSKECKAVIGVLITAKSRLLKKWKSVDASITDAMNDTKDKVKYLESLRRAFDHMYHEATPHSIMNIAIPGLTNSIKQMDSVSRYYGRVGFLGLILTKVTNQIVMACKDHIKSATVSAIDDKDRLWQKISEEVNEKDIVTTGDPQQKVPRGQVEAKSKVSRGKSKDVKEIGVSDDSLYGRLRACLTLQGFYRETLRSLRDSLGNTQNLSHFSSVSSFIQVNNIGTRPRGPSVKGAQSTSPSRRATSTVGDGYGHGVSLADEDAILHHMDLFCNRIRHLLDVINTISQYTKMVKTAACIPRPRKEDLMPDEDQELDERYRFKKVKPEPVYVQDTDETPTVAVSGSTSSPDRILVSITEADEIVDDPSDADLKDEKNSTNIRRADEAYEVDSREGLTEEEIEVLRAYYPEFEEDDGPSISTIIEMHVNKMVGSMAENITTKTMLDVESKDNDKFDEHYKKFILVVQDLETFLSAYLHVIFLRKMKTQQGLDIITRFTPIQNRPGIRGSLAEKFVEIFNWYEGDLDEVQKMYERNKEHPQTVRNAPPVAGAISWSRQLLKRIEDPMKVFRDNKAVSQLSDFSRIVRIYNRLATVLVTFESLWFTQWKNRIDLARAGLQATLFVHHPLTNEIVVNADERVLELIHEAKWLTRLEVPIPESAAAIMQQEGRFKNYKSHLELVLTEYRKVCKSIPEPLRKLFTSHMEFVEQQLQPGLATLAWNSMNIDAFLHQIHSATMALKNLGQKVNDLMESKVTNVINKISKFSLFDTETAFSKTWPLEEFRTEMLSNIKLHSSTLKQYVDTVLEGLQSVAHILTTKKLADCKNPVRGANLLVNARAQGQKKNTTDVAKTIKDKKYSLMTDGNDVAKDKLKAQKDEALMIELINYYRDQVYEAVLSATCQSLATLAEASGCGIEIEARPISSASQFSPEASPPSSHRSSRPTSRVVSATTERTASEMSTVSLSHLSNMSWSVVSKPTDLFLQFEIMVKFSIPNIIVEPTLNVVQIAVSDVANAIIEANKDMSWKYTGSQPSFYEYITENEKVKEMQLQLSSVIDELKPLVHRHIFHFSYYNFLWKDDMHGNFYEFIQADPGIVAIKREVERFLYIEKKVLGIPSVLPIGPICLITDPIKDALHGFSMAWKTKFASVLHEEAKKKLDAAVSYRQNVKTRLENYVGTLDQLNSALHLLEELRDMENKIDGIYLPIETMYSKLREFELRLPRNEVEEVDQLRDKWVELMELAEEVREILLKDRRGAFEQELDKQVKTFVVEVIQFRNAFDAQGPAVPGIPPSEAVSRLQDFQSRCTHYDAKRRTLDSVSKLFGIACKPFPELDRTGEELDLLSQLYGLFQKFIKFDTKFRDTLWAEADLEGASEEVEMYWDECLALPSKLKDWDAYNDLKTKLQTYLEVFPLLHNLASKVENKFGLTEIRNRHWLQVMQVTGSSFQLEGNIFKLCHLLDIGLIKYKGEMEEICRGASRELELEIKMRMTEEEWTEQVLNFEHYKKRGPMFLDKAFTERLLEQLDDAQALLASMLTSRYIGPLRDEAASWAEKLKEVAEVLELWLEVQDLWQYLEAVFSNSLAVRELPQEAKRFARIDKGWTKMMKRAFDTRNVLQCCYGGEVPKAVVLRHIFEELEICFKSLVGYLDNKRRAFPRFYFVSDPILLSVLSRPNDLESVRPHLRSVFSEIFDVKLAKAVDDDDEDRQKTPRSAHSLHEKSRSASVSPMARHDTPPRIDKRLTHVYDVSDKEQLASPTVHVLSKESPYNELPLSKSTFCSPIRQSLPKTEHSLCQPEFQLSSLVTRIPSHLHSMNPTLLQNVPTMLPSEGLVDDVIVMDAIAVQSADGESLTLQDKVTLVDGVEVWLSKLRDSVGKTLHDMNISVIQDCINGVPMDEFAAKYPAQVCRMGMLFFWTRECEVGITEVKYDRKALQMTLRKHITTTNKLSSVLTKGAWKTIDDPMLPMHKNRLECMITQSLYLRDTLDIIVTRKLREVTDFEWRRSIRCYLQPVEEEVEPLIWILDTSYEYGNEFYGSNVGVAITPVSERCFLTMSQALSQCQGTCFIGPTNVGKTENIKGLANILGNFIGMFQCSAFFDPVSIGKIVQGMAMDGCWGCFDESHNLNREAMAVLLDHVQCILSALKCKQGFMSLLDGQEIPVRKTVGIFMTADSLAGPPSPSAAMPINVGESFRMVTLMKPDFSQILKAKCAALGFRSPAVLSSRLKVMTELVKDQLPQQFHHHFTISALVGTLKRAAQKRRLIRDDKTSDRQEKKEDTSRSNSQASEATSSRPAAAAMAATSSKIGLSAQRKPGTPNPLSAAVKQEHALVCQTLEEIIGPRLTAKSMGLFKTILKDCFSGLPEPPSVQNITSAKSRGIEMETLLENKAQDVGLVPSKPFISKCLQLHNLYQAYHGIIVAGPPGSGKTSVIETLVESLCTSPRGMSRSSMSSKTSTQTEIIHKLLKINPMVVDDSDLMFGYINQNHDWVDGIFTTACRKANRNISVTWLCLDGPLNAGWADNFNSILSGDKTLHLKNGDKLFLSDNIILLFETDNLTTASPATVGRSGILYLDKDVVGWKPIAKAWLENRTHQEVHLDGGLSITDKSLSGKSHANICDQLINSQMTVMPYESRTYRYLKNMLVLQRAFQKTLDPISQFVLHEARPKVSLCEVGMFKTCLSLLSAMLADNIEIGGEQHIERVYLFCLIWTFGGLLDANDRKAFSDLLKTLSTALPDDDRDICVFDYYVDESGEWDPWHSRVPETMFADKQDMLGEVFVDTMDTIRTRILIEFAAASGQNVLLVGPHGSGKTSLINDFIDAQDPQLSVCKRLVFSGASTAKQLQQFIESNIYHRQGFVYGAKENKKLKVFIDDVNLPVPDDYAVQRSNELLRQLLDDHILCTLQSPFEWKTVEGLTVISAMALSDYPGMKNQLISERLLRHFAVFSMQAPQDDCLKGIVHGILETNMTDQDAPGLDIDLHNNIVAASCKILTALQSVLRPTPMPGRYHYLFTLKDLAKCFQCLKRLPDESRADEMMVVSLWKHEMVRILRDRLSRTCDINWFDDLLEETISEDKETWPKLEGTMHEYFVTFPIDARMYQRPVTSLGSKPLKVVLQPIEKLSDMHSCLNTHLTRYNEEFGNVRLNIMLSDYIIAHVIRMHRIISFHHGGNLLLIGAVGSHLATLCRLALHVADIPIHKVDTGKQSNFFDGIRSAVRMTGSEGKSITLMFTGRHLVDPVYLDAINSLLISGEYPHLFSNDEMDGLLQALHPAMKRDFPNMTVDPMKLFVARVKSNLHILICLPPNHELLKNASQQYPGLLSGCQINWMCDWPQESLLGEATYFVTKNQLAEEFEDLSENVTSCLANIHSFVMRDCKQMPWAGDLGPDVNLSVVKVNEKKKDQLKVHFMKVPNFPYSKTILQERIKLKHRDPMLTARNEIYVGPTTYKRFMDCFHHLYSKKSKERTEVVEKLKKVIATLDQTRTDAKAMKKAIKSLTEKFEDSKKKTATLLYQLSQKATVLEKLKAKVGLSTSLHAYLNLNEMETNEEEGDELLKEEEYDDYDVEFDKMREATLKTRVVQAKDEHAQALVQLEKCRQDLEYGRQQVVHWKSKVDRQCIERLKAFSNPPQLVGQVMEMVMTLIGKRLPSQRIQEIHSPHKDDLSSRMSSSSSSVKYVVKKPKGKEASERFDKTQWKQMQLTMSDSTKFVDMLHNVSWEDGLPEDVLTAVESYLCVGKDGQLGVTGEGSLLDNAADKSWSAVKRTPSPDNSKGISIAAAKFSSEDCAVLVQYTIAIVEYSWLCGPLKAALERLTELEREIEENERLQRLQEEEWSRTPLYLNAKRVHMKPEEEHIASSPEPEEDLSEADLPDVQSEVNALQKQFDLAVVEKHSLEMELRSMNERLKAATEIVESMKDQEHGWRQYVKDNDCNELLLSNCIVASAFLVYCAAVDIDTRKRMGEFFMHVCEHHKLPLHPKLLFKNIELIEFLYSPLDVMRLDIQNLPTTQLMLENAVFLMQEESITAWPMICDPTSRVLNWLHCYFKNTEMVETKYHEMRSQLENCLADGTPLLVTDCDITELVNDRRFRDTIRSSYRFIGGKSRFKVIVEDHEVECDPNFRLYLHTTIEPHQLHQHLAAYTTVMFFQQSRRDMEEELLNAFMSQEKSRLENERTTLRLEKLENMEQLHQLDQQMRNQLSSDVRLMNDLQATKRLADLMKQYDETLESESRVEANESSIMKAREMYRSLAQRAAVCFDTAQYMRELNPIYQSSFSKFQALFLSAVSHSERSAVKAVIEKLTYSAYTTFARSLLERDRLIYALLLAIEVEESQNRVGPGEREFLISPNYSSVVMSSLGFTQSPDSRIVQAKKPFDWMTDDQFHNLQVLATHLEWFQEMFDRMPKDGRETQWRNLCECDQPENMPLPDKMDDVYKPLQRLCVIRAVRSDRIIQASTTFIVQVLGKQYIGDVAIDLATMVKQSSPTMPIMLLFSHESQMSAKLFTDFANKKQMKMSMINLTDSNATTERAVRRHILKGMTEGSWVLLHNAHNATSLLSSIESLLAENPEQTDPQFRLWLSSQVPSTSKSGDINIPVRLLQNSVRAIIDSPKVMKDSLVRSFSWMEPDIFKQSSRSEWPVMLHNLCYLHAAISLRSRFGLGGWNTPTDFHQIGYSELLESINYTVGEFKEPLFMVGPDGGHVSRSISWTGIRFILSELVYGRYVTDSFDRQCLSALVDYWISPTAIKKDFEVARSVRREYKPNKITFIFVEPKVKYRPPPVFFSSNVRLNTVIQALENLNYHFLDTAEGCHLHPSVESPTNDETNLTLLGDDQYVFTRLNKVFDVMPSSPSLSHKLFPRPPSPFIGPALAGVSTQSNNPAVVGMGTFSTASYATFKMRKDVELWEICHSMLSKVPKAYNKDFITERVKQKGGFTMFNNFIMRELELMYKLVTEIKTTLQAIKVATEADVLGDQLSSDLLSAADDLYHLRIPQTWCQLAGYSAPPLTWGLGQWLIELHNRCHHFEKILSLGREKMPAYWLGAFFNPRGLLALLKLETMRSCSSDRSWTFEPFVFQTEVTSRDKDHLRDPPQEGMFVFGIYMWGCAWEKTTGELLDGPPRTSCASLPVVHVTCHPLSDKPSLQEPNRAAETFSCPVYHSRIAPRDSVFEMDVRREGIPSTRWALRGLSATIRPY